MKNKIATIGIIIATIILAGVAVFTAVRLYQLRQEAVAPTAPTSKPKAQETSTTSCNALSFVLGSTPTPTPTATPISTGVSCASKKAYFAADSDTTISDKNFDFSLGGEISNNGNAKRGDSIIFVITITETNSKKAYTTSDALSSRLQFVNYASTDNCSVNSTTHVVSCPGTDTGRTDVKIKLKTKVLENATLGELVNTASIAVGEETPTNCRITLVVTTPAPTATPTNPPGEPNSCGGTCGSNYNCQSGLFCYSGFCRNPSCPTQTSCSCPRGTATPTATPKLTSTPRLTPTPTQASLPDAGTSLPTIFGIGIGTLLLIGAIILAL